MYVWHEVDWRHGILRVDVYPKRSSPHHTHTSISTLNITPVYIIILCRKKFIPSLTRKQIKGKCHSVHVIKPSTSMHLPHPHHPLTHLCHVHLTYTVMSCTAPPLPPLATCPTLTSSDLNILLILSFLFVYLTYPFVPSCILYYSYLSIHITWVPVPKPILFT